MTPKLWGGRFEAEPSELLRRLNDSFAFDRELFAEDVQGSIAWAGALGEAGVLTASEAQTIVVHNWSTELREKLRSVRR